MNKQHFFYALALFIIAVFYLAITTPISPHEAKVFYNSSDLVFTLMHWGDSFLTAPLYGFLGLRIFFIFFGFLSLALFYELSRQHFTHDKDIYLSSMIFMLLPGILTGFSLANVAIIVLPIVLLFVLLYEKKKYLLLPFLMLALFFVHEASIIFFVGILLYGLVHKDKKLSILAAAFLSVFVYLAKGIEIGGRPSGHFAEIFGLYASVFSPLLFLYFFYAMYRILLREKKNLLWYISFTALAFSLLLSLRQRVDIADFAPYVMISVVLMLDTLNHSVRVRLPEFQKYYKRGFYVTIGFLILSASVIIFHKASYLLTGQKKKHFATSIYKPYYLALQLKKDKVACYDKSRGRERYQLKYHGILLCRDF